jgi:putative SOS response-associated peptidase YedK
VCTNFTPTRNAQWVKDKLGVALPLDFPKETYPGYASPLVLKSQRSGRVACGLARFSLIPGWAKDNKISRHTYNARSETAAEKPSFRDAMNKRRCVVPASFYVEWRDEAADVQLNLFGEPTAISKPKKVKYAFFRADAEVTILAGLWERWAAPEGPLETFTILTCAPNELAGEFHDRMPCLLSDEDAETWLRPSTTVEEAQALLRPFDSAQMSTRLIAD